MKAEKGNNQRRERERKKIRLSLLQKILLLTIITLAVPTIWFEGYSSHMVRTMMEQQAVMEEANAVALAAASVDHTVRNLVLQTLGMYHDEKVKQLSGQIEEGNLTKAQWQQMNLTFVEQADSVMMMDRIYKMDMKIYAALTYENRGLFNFNCSDSDMDECLDILETKKPDNPYLISWGGLLKNYDMYRFRNEDHLLVLGKQMEEEQPESPVLWLGGMENAVHKQLFPNGRRTAFSGG